MSLQVSPAAAAGIAASQIANSVSNVLKQATDAITNGIPARGNQAAISAADLVAALTQATATKIQSAAAAVA